MNKKRMLVAFAVSALVSWSANATLAQEPFYKGKTIRVVVATSAGGGFDAYTRMMTRHMGKFVPGNPAFVVENMPGAGHLIGANHMYKVAKPDGLTLGHFQGGLFLYQVFGRPGIEFDAKQFEFIGSPIKESRACAFTKASGITSVEKWLASKTPVKLGGIGGAAPDDIARMLAARHQLPIVDLKQFHEGERTVLHEGQRVLIVRQPGGPQTKLDPNGQYMVEQMYVQYFLPRQRKGKLPSDHAPEALADYVHGQGASVVVIPAELTDLHGLEVVEDGEADWVVAGLDRRVRRVAGAQFLADALVDQHVAVHRDADGEHDADDARQGERRGHGRAGGDRWARPPAGAAR